MNKKHQSEDRAAADGAMEAPAQVQGMFSRIARRYDLANALLSGGMDALWRRRAAGIVRGWQPTRLLDAATGSGILAQTLARACPAAMIVGGDFCPPMLQQARKRRLEHLVAADAMRLPFDDAVFDAVTVAFGLRNMASWPDALREMGRVLKPGGHLLVLDFSMPGNALLRTLYRPYLHRCLPFIAGVLSGERGAYEYLAESIERFPRGESMLRLFADSGFQNNHAEELTGGIVSLYTGEKGRAD